MSKVNVVYWTWEQNCFIRRKQVISIIGDLVKETPKQIHVQVGNITHVINKSKIQKLSFMQEENNNEQQGTIKSTN